MSSTALTRGILVEVESQYVPERSDPRNHYYFFAYHITITNQGSETVQLLRRHWIIVDESGHVEEVHGPGVVGEQPVIEPGEFFRYSSACPLPTSKGSMRGSYQMKLENGQTFDAEIPCFELAPTYTLH